MRNPLSVNSSLAISIGGGDQLLEGAVDGVYVTTAGDIVGRLAGDVADSTWPVEANQLYPFRFAVIRQTGTTAAGRLVRSH